MRNHLLDVLDGKKLAIVITFIFAIIPFFWFKSAEMDLGGDSARLYFVDPKAYLSNLNLYFVSPQGIGEMIVYQFSTPFILLLLFLKTVLGSSYILVILMKSFILAGGFLCMYLSVYELLLHNVIGKITDRSIRFAALLGGLFYILNPIVQYGGWNRELFDHTQIVINPLVFYLLLRLIHTHKQIYALITIVVTFIFSVNFSLTSAPKFFAFYPIALLFLCFYSFYIQKNKINLLSALFYIFLLFLLHAFHTIPLLINFFDKSSLTYYKIFASDAQADAIHFFNSFVPYIKLHKNLLGLAPESKSVFNSTFFVFPITIFTGAYFYSTAKKKNKGIRLVFVGIFAAVLITCFFASAGVTNIGFDLYTLLFSIPGFSMFRSFFGQWAHSYIFYFSVLLGLSFYSVFQNIRSNLMYTIVAVSVVILCVNSWNFIQGSMANAVVTNANGKQIPSTIKFDADYEKLLSYIKTLPGDGKILSLPLTDHFYQIIAGEGEGRYLGPSTISYLTGKSDFSGFQILKPYSEQFQYYVKEKDYESINKLLGLLNIQYIFYNSDPRVLHDFPDFPYQSAREYLPTTQEDYAKFITELKVREIATFGSNYYIFKLDDKYVSQGVYVSASPIFAPIEYNEAGYITTHFINSSPAKNSPYPLFLNEASREDSTVPVEKVPQISYKKVNPAKYEVSVTNVSDPYYLVLQSAFNGGWTVFNGGDALSVKHLPANGYGNAWFITPETMKGSSYKLTIFLTSQKFIYWGNILTMIGLFIVLLWLSFLSFPSFAKRSQIWVKNTFWK